MDGVRGKAETNPKAFSVQSQVVQYHHIWNKNITGLQLQSITAFLCCRQKSMFKFIFFWFFKDSYFKDITNIWHKCNYHSLTVGFFLFKDRNDCKIISSKIT